MHFYTKIEIRENKPEVLMLFFIAKNISIDVTVISMFVHSLT